MIKLVNNFVNFYIGNLVNCFIDINMLKVETFE